MTLDKTKPYCTVYGDPVVRYEQDGRKYTREGHPVVETKVDVKTLTGVDRKNYFRNLVMK